MKIRATAHGKSEDGDGYAPMGDSTLANIHAAEAEGWKVVGFTVGSGQLDEFTLEMEVPDGNWRAVYDAAYSGSLRGLGACITCEVVR